jgi:hypothetical protein
VLELNVRQSRYFWAPISPRTKVRMGATSFPVLLQVEPELAHVSMWQRWPWGYTSTTHRALSHCVHVHVCMRVCSHVPDTPVMCTHLNIFLKWDCVIQKWYTRIHYSIFSTYIYG